jgi:hypothetical protein
MISVLNPRPENTFWISSAVGASWLVALMMIFEKLVIVAVGFFILISPFIFV